MPKLLRTAVTAIGGLLLIAASPSRAASFLDAEGHIERGLAAVDAGGRDMRFARLLAQARGVLIVPHIGVGGPVIGFPGGEGLLVTQHDGLWSDPVFYHVGEITVTGWTGLTRRSLIILLMSQKAVDAVTYHGQASLNGPSGLSVVSYQSASAAAVFNRDVIVWSNAPMAMSSRNIGVSGLSPDRPEDRAFYGQDLTISDILGGVVWTAQSSTLGAELHRLAGRSTAKPN